MSSEATDLRCLECGHYLDRDRDTDDLYCPVCETTRDYTDSISNQDK